MDILLWVYLIGAGFFTGIVVMYNCFIEDTPLCGNLLIVLCWPVFVGLFIIDLVRGNV